MALSHAWLVLFFACQGHATSLDSSKNRPVTKVINLLKDMVSQLEKEAEDDKDVFEKMQCWCDTNEKEKTKSIADAESRIGQLTTAIESFSAQSARLNTEIANLNEEVEKNSEALEKAAALRRKELAEFNAEEKETIQTIGSLKSAVVALSKHHEAVFLQQDSTSSTMNFLSTVAGLRSTMHRNADMLDGMFTATQRKTLTNFLNAPESHFGKISLIQTSATVGAPASGEIFGMLKQMKEGFETNLKSSQQEETKNQGDFESMKAAKTEEIAAGTEQSETKTQELAASDEKNAQSKQDLEDTRATLEADSEFLTEVKEKCEGMDAEFAQRTKDRQMEIVAVGKALAFLNSDEAHELFSKTLGFVQVKATHHSKRRQQAAKLLSEAAHKFQDPNLVLLATSAKIDAFTEVKKKIQALLDELTKEQADEVELKDFCIKELNTNEADQEAKTRDKADLAAKIEDLATTVTTLGKEMEVLKAEVAEMQVQIKRAGENREKVNMEFQKVVADQRATQKLLAAALNILKEFYNKAALVQIKSHASTMQPSFNKMEKNANSGGVMGMMEEIINEAKGLEAEAVRGESDAQQAYEGFVKESNNGLDAKTKDLVNKSEAKAKAEAAKVEAENAQQTTMGTLESLAAENADLHKSCDFTLKNFDLRQTARASEMEAMKQTMTILSGASFSALLQEGENDDPYADDPFNGI